MPAPQIVIHCPAGVWTKVLWSSFVIRHYQGSFSGATGIEWARYSTLPPWYTHGFHDTRLPFDAWTAGAYCDFWFRSATGVTVTWSLTT